MTTEESRDPGEFWGKILSAAKVKRVLRKRGFDPEAFRRDYEADTSRGPRGPKRPSKTEMDAVGAFQKTGDFGASRRSSGARVSRGDTPLVGETGNHVWQARDSSHRTRFFVNRIVPDGVSRCGFRFSQS
jgi:hypothetical protein